MLVSLRQEFKNYDFQMHALVNTQPTSWSRVLLEKLTVTPLFKKFPAFYGTQKFIIVSTRTRHRSLTTAICIPHTLSHPISPRSIIILSSHLRLGLPSPLPFKFSYQNTVRISHLSHVCYMPRPSILLDFIILIILGEAYKL